MDGLLELARAEREALLTLPLPRDANPVRLIAARPYSSTWRKSSKHWKAMLSLERKGLVERTVSRGETLWRLTRPSGFAAARAHEAEIVKGEEE